ncbi:MAG: hypothetical protein JO199_14690 [Candidatus Eremiobacteraeota bacterium]|nr:hypothetical protein [Candidatus Eremiobacteraeota bacterium]
MAEIFGAAGQPVEKSGTYACTLCGHREHFTQGTPFPTDHHEGHPWTMMVAD